MKLSKDQVTLLRQLEQLTKAPIGYEQGAKLILLVESKLIPNFFKICPECNGFGEVGGPEMAGDYMAGPAETCPTCQGHKTVFIDEKITKHPITCVAVFLHDQKGSVLIGRRLQKTTIEGVPENCLPGGKIDWQEDPSTAIIRETKEETGLDIEIEKFVTYSNDRWPDLDVHCVTLYYQAKVIGGILTTPEPEKVDQWAWVKKDEVGVLFADCHEFVKLLTI